MGNDYAARRKAKRKPSHGAVEFLDKAKLGGNKERPKRAKVRRLCRGHCYQEPVVRADDRQWPEDEMMEGAGTKRLKRSELPIIVPGQQPIKDTSGPNKVKKNRRRGKRNSGIHNLSTSVKLDIPQNAHLGEQEACGPSEGCVSVEALSMYPDAIQRYLVSQGFIEATPVQEGCWQPLVDGHDVIGIAHPGSGKTLAFLLPAVSKMTNWIASHDCGPPPWVIVIVPTRELANQMLSVCRPFYKMFGIRTTCVYGGVDSAAQIEALEQIPHIVIGTPGRMVDLMRGGHLNLGSVKYIALDEGDKLLSPSMLQECEILRRALFEDKKISPQIAVFSATMPDDITAQLNRWLSNHKRLEFKPSARSVSQTITQVIHVCAEHKKAGKLQKYLSLIQQKSLQMRQKPRILIFSNTVKKVRFLEGLLQEEHKVNMLHGKRTQKERNEAMVQFRAGKIQILIATDVAARGLHIRNLPYIINYDFPSRLETYIHRVGRTGRLAAYGHAYSFITRNMAKLAPDLVDFLGHHHQDVDPNLLILSNAIKATEDFRTAEEDGLEEVETDDNRLKVDMAASGDEGGNSILSQMTDALLSNCPRKDKKKRRKRGLLEK